MRIKNRIFILLLCICVLTVFSIAEVPAMADTDASGDTVAIEEADDSSAGTTRIGTSADKAADDSSAETDSADKAADTVPDKASDTAVSKAAGSASARKASVSTAPIGAGSSSDSKSGSETPEPAKLRITAVQVNSNVKNNIPGKFKVKFSGSWSESGYPAALKKQGYAVKYSLQDANGKVLKNGINLTGIKYPVKNDKKKYRIVCVATKKGKPTLTIKSPLTAIFRFLPVPGKVKVTSPKSNYNVIVKWGRVSDACGYLIYRSKKKKIPASPLKYIAGGNKVKFVDKKMAGGTYYYWIRTVYKGKNTAKVYKTASVPSPVKKVSVKEYLRCKIQKIGWHATAKKKGALYKNKTGSAKKGSIKKGTKLVVTKKYPKLIKKQTAKPKRVYVIQYKDGKAVKQGWVKWGVVKKVKGTTSWNKKLKRTVDWPKSVKEAYVKNKTSKTKYLIWTSTYTQKVNIFKKKNGKWKLIKCFNTSTGKYVHPTKMGMKQRVKRHQKKKIRTSPKGNKYFFTHLTFFSCHAFHTISWRLGTHRVIKGMNQHGQPNTLGSVRLSVKNARWIYYNIPYNTRVLTH